MNFLLAARDLITRRQSNGTPEQGKAEEKKEQSEKRLSAVKKLDERIQRYRESYPHPEGSPEQLKSREKIFKKWEAFQKLPGKDDETSKPYLARIASFMRGVTSLESEQIDQLPMALIYQQLGQEARRCLAETSRKVRDNVYALTSEDFKKYERRPELINAVPLDILFNCLQSIALGTTSFNISDKVKKIIANACLRKCLQQSPFDFRIFKAILEADIADGVVIDATPLMSGRTEKEEPEVWCELVMILKELKNVRKFELVALPIYCHRLIIIPSSTKELVIRDCNLFEAKFEDHIKRLKYVHKLELSNITWHGVNQRRTPLQLPTSIEEIKLDNQALEVVQLGHCAKLKSIQLGTFSLTTQFPGFPPSVEQICFNDAKPCGSQAIVDDQFIKQHLATLPNLHTLVFDGNRNCLFKGETLSQLPEKLSVQIAPTSMLSQEGLLQYLARQKPVSLRRLEDVSLNREIDLAAVLDQLPEDAIESVELGARLIFINQFSVLLALSKQTHLRDLAIHISPRSYPGKVFNTLPISLESIEINASKHLKENANDINFERLLKLKTFKCDSLVVLKLLGKLPSSVKHIFYNRGSGDSPSLLGLELQEVQKKLQSLKELESFSLYGPIYDDEKTLSESEYQVLENLLEFFPGSLKALALPKLCPQDLQRAMSKLKPLRLTMLEICLPYFGKEERRAISLPASLTTLKVRGCDSLKDLLAVIDLEGLPYLKEVEVKFLGKDVPVKYEAKNGRLVSLIS